VALGRFPRIYVIAAFGQVFDIPTWVLEVVFAAGVAFTVITAILRRIGWIGAPPPEERSPESTKPSTPPPAA
jgi:hypothetical protein